MALERAGEEGWSVAVMVVAWAREQMTDGRAAPTILSQCPSRMMGVKGGKERTYRLLIPAQILP